MESHPNGSCPSTVSAHPISIPAHLSRSWGITRECSADLIPDIHAVCSAFRACIILLEIFYRRAMHAPIQFSCC
jgi:hypothetical protein